MRRGETRPQSSFGSIRRLPPAMVGCDLAMAGSGGAATSSTAIRNSVA